MHATPQSSSHFVYLTREKTPLKGISFKNVSDMLHPTLDGNAVIRLWLDVKSPNLWKAGGRAIRDRSIYLGSIPRAMIALFLLLLEDLTNE